MDDVDCNRLPELCNAGIALIAEFIKLRADFPEHFVEVPLFCALSRRIVLEIALNMGIVFTYQQMQQTQMTLSQRSDGLFTMQVAAIRPCNTQLLIDDPA